MKKKTYVLTVSKTFFKGHPRQGEETGFKEKILAGLKIHTIRAGDYWKKVIEKVNSGEAVLSVREWSGKPYASKQVEICQFEKLGMQVFEIDNIFKIDQKFINSNNIYDVALNDGLSYSDFLDWFKYPKKLKGVIIHFTDFRY